VIFMVHEMKRLGRGVAELLAIAEELRHHDIELEAARTHEWDGRTSKALEQSEKTLTLRVSSRVGVGGVGSRRSAPC
jgi:hypothetical protein